MEHSATEYSQSGLPSPHPSHCGDPRSEGSSADQPSAAQYSSQQEVRPSSYSTSATPTSEYGVYPSSARSGSFPEHIHQRPYHPASNPSASSGGMAQQTNSPSLSRQDGPNHQTTHHQFKSDNDVTLDPSIAGPSPTYPYGQPSPYGPPPADISHGYQHAYPQPRADWTGYGQHSAALTPAGHVFPPTASSAPPPGRPHQVRSPLAGYLNAR